jgi:hypothetical protein
MKVKFREHRGSLEESMATVVELESMDDLRQRCRDLVTDAKLLDEIRLVFLCYDSRVNWDTYIVFIPGYGVLGHTNGELK